MTSSFDNETNQVEDEYYGEYEDNLNDFIVHSDDEEEKALKKQKLHQQEEENQEEEEEEESEEEEEEEEAPVGVQEILSLREQLKEKIRRRNAAMAAGVSNGSSSMKQTTPPAKDRFGTFFGPSRQSLAPRVIQEGTSMMKELHNARPRKDASLVSEAKPSTSRSLQKTKIITEEKRKADALRENRDYSSLFSDDAEAPPATREQPCNRSALVPKPDVQVRGRVSPAGKNRTPNGQSQTNGHGLKGTPPSSHGRVQNKAGSPGKGPLADIKRTVPAARNGSTPATMKKTTGLMQPSPSGQKVQPALQSKREQAPLPGQRQQQAPSQGRTKQQSQSQRLQSNGHQQMRKHSSAQDGSVESHGRARPAQKQLVASSKLKKGAVKRKASDGEYASIQKELRAVTGYDPSKYAGRDEDDRNMEADYASILKEERRSAKLARQEDQEQLRLIEEEERRERAKKRKKQVADTRLEAAEPF